MAKPSTHVTPANRLERWKKLWGGVRRLEATETDDAFDEFADNLVPSHMHKLFLKSFGQPKAQFGNRFFVDEATYQNWDTKLSMLGAEGTHAEVTIIYGSPDKLEAHAMRGEVRRTLRDILIDDWHAACAIVRAGSRTLYVFIEPKMRGCIVRSIRGESEAEPEPVAEPEFIEADDNRD
ncbi:MAG: hypothetical protein ACO1SV_06500 [Fimbriimonas sp.]